MSGCYLAVPDVNKSLSQGSQASSAQIAQRYEHVTTSGFDVLPEMNIRKNYLFERRTLYLSSISTAPEMAAACAHCKGELTVDIASGDSDDGMTSVETVPDDVVLACGDRFHWQCLLDSCYEIAKCPSCESDIASSAQETADSSIPRILATVDNEGGLQHNVDLYPILQEECYLKTYPEESKSRTFLEFCREGDHRAAVSVLLSPQEEDEVDAQDTKPLDSAAILRYQDPLAGEQSALHAAAASGHREIAWLLLLLASEYPELDIPALVYQEASSLGVMREDQSGKIDIRTLRDAQGRTAEDIAKESGDVIWTGWFGNSRLSL